MTKQVRHIRGSRSAVLLCVLLACLVATFLSITASKKESLTLTAGNGFTVTGVVTGSPTSTTPALLYPGTSRYLALTVHNPLSTAITVTTLRAVINQQTPLPTGCSATNLDLGGATFSGARVVSAGSTSTISVPIRLANTGSNQDACRNVTFGLTYSGSATYVQVFQTTTTITSSVNPSRIGQKVSYTVAVTATGGPPNSPTGTITVKDGSVMVCSNIPVTPTSANTATATCAPPAYIADGKRTLTAVFTNTDGNFSGSTSPALIQTVVATPPTRCPGPYQNIITGTPGKPNLTGTNGNDLIFAWGANYTVDGRNGNDCIDAGDGNNKLLVGNGKNVVIAGDGTNNVTLGNGEDKVILGDGSNSIILGGNGDETIYLGRGRNNTYRGGTGQNVCHLIAPPSTWHGTAAAYYDDTLTKCTVVSP